MEPEIAHAIATRAEEACTHTQGNFCRTCLRDAAFGVGWLSRVQEVEDLETRVNALIEQADLDKHEILSLKLKLRNGEENGEEKEGDEENQGA